MSNIAFIRQSTNLQVSICLKFGVRELTIDLVEKLAA
jgi:hypothetical protein